MHSSTSRPLHRASLNKRVKARDRQGEYRPDIAVCACVACNWERVGNRRESAPADVHTPPDMLQAYRGAARNP